MEPYRIRLSLMMFGQYIIMGAWLVTLGTYLMASPSLGGLNFPPSYAGWIYSTLAIAGIISPMFVGLLADRLFSAQKLMAFFHLTGALLLGAAAWWCAGMHSEIESRYRELAVQEQIEGVSLLEAEQLRDRPDLESLILEAQQRNNTHPEMQREILHGFWPLFWLMLAYSLAYSLTLTLSSVTTLRNLLEPEKNFSTVRLWGTVGWMVAGVLVELGLQPISPMPLFFAAGISGVVGLYCLTLPSTPPSGKGRTLGEAFGLPALKLFADKSFLVMVLCAFAAAVSQQFYVVYTNRYLNELGAPVPAATQTLAQVAEVICMAIFALLVSRIGLRWMMFMGLVALALRNGFFASEVMWVVVLLGLPLHGFSYAFFSVSASIYVDRKAPDDLRASAQGINTFITMGSGTLLGNFLSGRIVEAYTLGNKVIWPEVWLIPTVMCLAIALVFIGMFRE